jgi:outer membrane protein TolC
MLKTLVANATLSLITLSLSAVALAQTEPSLSLNAALEEGLQNSPDIQRQKAVVEETDWKHFEVLGAGFLPKVSAGAHHYFDDKFSETSITLGGPPISFPGFYPSTEATFDVTIPIFDGLANVRNLQAASYNRDAASAELSFAQFKLTEEIRLAFYKALAASQLQSVAEQNVKTLEDHLKQVEARQKGGVATNYDLLRVQVQLSEARADSIDAVDNVETTRRQLNVLLGREDDKRPLMGALPIPEAKKVQELKFRDDFKERADLQALMLRAQAANSARAASSAWYVPQIALGGQYGFYNAQTYTNAVSDTGNYLNTYNFGIFLKWNLFDGGVAIAQHQEAAYRQVQAEKTTQAAKLQVPADFEYWKRRYLSNTDHYASKKFDITRSEESVRLAKEEERAGTRTSTETLDAELDLFRAKAGVINSLVNVNEAQIRLELTLGREI